jgi:aspartate 1-decarboxylase
MIRTMLKGKVHNAIVTEADLNYEGSLTLDETLMMAADMRPFEKIDVYNITNGERFSTYLIKGKKDSGVVGINGAAAHKAKAGDRVIITSYSLMEDVDIEFFRPKIVLIGRDNTIKEIK